ncbi:MAG: GAF domain-containing protein [Syntrophaceae bacterium]|nr:GAF domain-containing protein [Syntrophaceae bacterium]
MNEKEINKTENNILLALEKEVFKKQYLKMRDNYDNKIKELSIIKELMDSLRLTSINDKNALFREQLKVVKKNTSLEQISLFILNEELQMLELVATANAKKKSSLEYTQFLNLDEGTPGIAFSLKKPIIINDVQEAGSREEKMRVQGQSLLCVPVMDGIKVIGILELTHRMKNKFDQNQVNFFSLVANQISTAVVLFRLYAQMLKEESRRFLLSRFFSKTITEEILGKKGFIQLGGERKKATIVFVDIHGFTSISERLDQEEVVEILNAFFSHMTPIIFKNNGTLDKLMGDGMMAIFGAPISNDDDAVRAVRTVIEMITVLKVFNEQHSERGWPRLSVGIGVNAGEVVAGYIGSEDHLNYTVIGDAVNTAQRLQSIASEDEIIISKAVKDAIGDKISEVDGLKGLTPLPSQKVKGKKNEIDVFRVEI